MRGRGLRRLTTGAPVTGATTNKRASKYRMTRNSSASGFAWLRTNEPDVGGRSSVRDGRAVRVRPSSRVVAGVVLSRRLDPDVSGGVVFDNVVGGLRYLSQERATPLWAQERAKISVVGCRTPWRGWHRRGVILSVVGSRGDFDDLEVRVTLRDDQ